MSARVATVLVATGLASAAITAASAAPRPGLVPAALLAAIGLTLLASLDRAPRASVQAALVLSLLVLADPSPRGIGVAAVVAVALWRQTPARRHLAVAAAALGAPALTALAYTGAPAAAAAVVGLALVLVAGPTGPALALLAAATLVAWRHLLASSAALAPDDVAAVAAAAAIPLALARPAAGTRIAVPLSLATFALASVSLIAGVPYHSDAVALAHRAAEVAVTGASPYTVVDAPEAVARFGLRPEFLTHLESGEPLRSFNYPALSFLVPAPLVAAGLPDLRPLYALELLLLVAVVAWRVGQAWRAHVVAAAVGSAPIVRQVVLAGVDPLWAVLTAASLALFRVPLVSAVLLGLACAARQPAWFVVPLYVALALRVEGARPAAIRATALVAAFVAPHLPYLALDGPALVRGVLAPMVEPLEPHGVGLVGLALDGLLPLLPRGVYGLLAAAALGAAVVAVLRGATGLAAVGWTGALALAWRSLLNYFAFGPLLLLALAPVDVRSGPPRTTEGDDADRPGAARDPGLSGGSPPGP